MVVFRFIFCFMGACCLVKTKKKHWDKNCQNQDHNWNQPEHLSRQHLSKFIYPYQEYLSCYWPNFDSWEHLNSNCHSDICRGSICPGNIWLYQEYLNSYLFGPNCKGKVKTIYVQKKLGLKVLDPKKFWVKKNRSQKVWVQKFRCKKHPR